jgi:CheY-like chemotaxis protein
MLSGLRILVVEDERGVRLLLRRLLEAAGASVAVATSPDEALAEFDRQPPDVLVSDIRMPGGDGYQLIHRVRERPADRGGRIPAVAVSGSVGAEDIAKILVAGFQKFIRKPFDVAEMREAIKTLAGRAGP